MALEDSLKSWAKPPGETEQGKCDNAVRMIRQAVEASTRLRGKNIRVFAQGSYCNRTNVRQDSDVDVCVLCTDTFFYDLPQGMLAARFNLNSPATYQEHVPRVVESGRRRLG
jgi:tRNA nucleotidyltransferase (CCA-adding enzyme)